MERKGGFVSALIVIIAVAAVMAGVVGWNYIRHRPQDQSNKYSAPALSKSAAGSQFIKLYLGQSTSLQSFTVKLSSVSSVNGKTVANLDIKSNNDFSRSVGEREYSGLGPGIYLVVDQIESANPTWATVNISQQIPSGFSDAGASAYGGSSSSGNQNPSTPKTTNSPSAESSSAAKAPSNEKPVLGNLGVNFGAWDKSTGKAGDFAFVRPDWTNKIFLEFGASVYSADTGGQKILPHFTYVLNSGVPIMAPTSLVMVFVSWQPDSKDYEIQGHPIGADGRTLTDWLIDYDHVVNLPAKLMSAYNASLKAGNTTIAGGTTDMQIVNVSVPFKVGETVGYGTEKVELAVEDLSKWRATGITYAYCPLLFVRSDLLTAYEADIRRLETDWESFMGDNSIYSPSKEFMPGCLYKDVEAQSNGAIVPAAQ